MQDLLREIAELKAQNDSLVIQNTEQSNLLAQQKETLSKHKTQLAEKEQRIAAQDFKILNLEQQLEKHLKRLFGKSSEKLNLQTLPLFSQQALGEADLFEEESEEATTEEPASGKKKKRNPHTKKLPKNLRREVVEHKLDDCSCPHCQHERKSIGYEKSERLAYQPAEVYVIEHRQHKYACAKCDTGVQAAPKPAELIPGGQVDSSLISQIILSKFADHLPLYRLEQIFKRNHVPLQRASMWNWLNHAALALAPLVDYMHWRMLQGEWLQADETPVRLQEKGGCKQCYFWLFRGEEHYPYTLCEFATGRSSQVAKDWFSPPDRWQHNQGGYGDILPNQGTLLCDGYGGYKALFDPNGAFQMSCAHCWAHARRKFVEAEIGSPEHASQALQLIGELYKVEKESKDSSDEERHKMRQNKSKVIMRELNQWRKAMQQENPLPQSQFGKALSYLDNHWSGLQTYLDQPALPIDNNAIERDIRGIAVGRKNWLFTGSERGGHAAAILMSVLISAKRNELNLKDYLADLLKKLPQCKNRLKPTAEELEPLLPDRWVG